MKKRLLLTSMLLCLSSSAMASDWLAPFLGGAILGNMYNEYQRRPVGPNVLVIPAQPVYTQDPYAVPPNPYMRNCRVEDVFDRQGRYLGRQQICN